MTWYWYALIAVGYVILLWLLCRFMAFGKQCDDDIQKMMEEEGRRG